MENRITQKYDMPVVDEYDSRYVYTTHTIDYSKPIYISIESVSTKSGYNKIDTASYISGVIDESIRVVQSISEPILMNNLSYDVVQLTVSKTRYRGNNEQESIKVDIKSLNNTIGIVTFTLEYSPLVEKK